MGKQQVVRQPHIIKISDDPERAGAMLFRFETKGAVPGEPKRPFIVSVEGHGATIRFTWTRPPAHEQTKLELEAIARQRADSRHEWLDRLSKLVGTMEKWATDLGWSTKVIEKRMEDPEVGNYKAPALLMQQELVRILLEPVARSAPGTEGVVDLYLMPSYDDIASLYYYDDRWNVHYLSHDSRTVASIREAKARPLTKATLRKVIDEMRAHAG